MASKSGNLTGRSRKLILMLAAFTLVAAACGGDDDDSSGDDAPAATDAPDDSGDDADDSGDDADADDSGDDADAGDDADSGDDADADDSGDDADAGDDDMAEPMGMHQEPGVCGEGTGEEATGDPIKLGGMATTAPGFVFDWIPRMSAIYFDCVNANGGIGGRPIEYIWEEEQLDPAQIASLAVKLVEEDEVLGIVGNTSATECDINGDYYAENGYHPIIAGVAPGCFLSPQWSAVNMGPYYSNLGAAQAAVNMGATSKLVVITPTVVGDFNNQSVIDFAESVGMEGVGILEDVPLADPAGLALRLAQEAGPEGAVILNFNPPEDLQVLQAIDDQGLIDAVAVWAASTPPNDPSIAAALSEAWDGKFFINAEFNVLNSGLPDDTHMVDLHTAAGAEFPIGAFPQMGYLIARVTTEALMSIEGDINKESVNEAIFNITGFESDLLCKPWYYSSGLDVGNVSNNTDRTVVPQGDEMVQVEDCFDIAALDTNPLGAIREAEAARG